MNSHRLILEGGSRSDEWLLEWDDARFVIRNPEGKAIVDCQSAVAHRFIDPYELYDDGKISFTSPSGRLRFKGKSAVLSELRAFVDTGLLSDCEYRTEIRSKSLCCIPLGIVIFVVAGSLFGLYCWYASWAPEPPPGHWIRWIGGLIHWILLLLMAAIFVGLSLTVSGTRRWWRIRRIERALARTEQEQQSRP